MNKEGEEETTLEVLEALREVLEDLRERVIRMEAYMKSNATPGPTVFPHQVQQQQGHETCHEARMKT